MRGEAGQTIFQQNGLTVNRSSLLWIAIKRRGNNSLTLLAAIGTPRIRYSYTTVGKSIKKAKSYCNKIL
jgi:hypothetical protein